jgi:RNA polymerase sigma-70 factor (ECF subfamily)
MIDHDLHLPAIAGGDTTAFGRWLAVCERPMRESLRSFARSIDTEAVLQEALLRVWQVAPRVVPDGKPNSLLRLGLRMARNLAISETRRLRGAPLDDEALARLPELKVDAAPPSDRNLRRHIDDCRDRLPAKPAEALAARLASGGQEPDPVLAERLGMRPNTFLQNFTRARKLLADCLEGKGVDLALEHT